MLCQWWRVLPSCHVSKKYLKMCQAKVRFSCFLSHLFLHQRCVFWSIFWSNSQYLLLSTGLSSTSHNMKLITSHWSFSALKNIYFWRIIYILCAFHVFNTATSGIGKWANKSKRTLGEFNSHGRLWYSLFFPSFLSITLLSQSKKKKKIPLQLHLAVNITGRLNKHPKNRDLLHGWLLQSGW